MEEKKEKEKRQPNGTEGEASSVQTQFRIWIKFTLSHFPQVPSCFMTICRVRSPNLYCSWHRGERVLYASVRGQALPGARIPSAVSVGGLCRKPDFETFVNRCNWIIYKWRFWSLSHNICALQHMWISTCHLITTKGMFLRVLLHCSSTSKPCLHC